MGADQNPSPRGDIMEAKRHGLELAGAVVGVLQRPMQPVEGACAGPTPKRLFHFTRLPTAVNWKGSSRCQRLCSAKSSDVSQNARSWETLPEAVVLPMSVMRIGESLSFLNMAGEVVVDYSLLFKRLYKQSGPGV